jgi:hypothetical protein
MKKLVYLIFFGTLFGCSEDEPLSNTPILSLIEIGPTTLMEFQDSLVIQIGYEDGDGDLGGGHADSSDLFVVDKRIDIAYTFRIQDLVPGNEQVPIKGKLNIVLNNLYLIDTGESEMMSFEIYAFDQRKNESNHINTPSIKLVR